MKNIFNRSILTIFSTIFFTINTVTPAQANFTFDEVEIDQNQVIATAMPLSDLNGYSGYQLIILEQRSNQRPCWSESEAGLYPILVEPLLLDFNFSGICGRATDSNGYSIRVDGNDLSVSHRLILQNVGGEIKLFGISLTGDKKLIGRSRGLSNGMMKIFLEPGWQFTKRSYQGKVLGHFYFSYDSFAAKQAEVEQRISEIEAQIPDSLEFYDNTNSAIAEGS
ncbi:MAG: DUF3747 domain-containing protein [Okeania sp. SIO3B5]|uniref:DUF3747 domain-containing protein n=1 Tax=Okeania sp. SIO3B5 TaxID=2607811 RepID=UPI001401BA4C|nr:DUF3747 domain-containing protein [Okeania sp. SIO3B5]NEO55475.1 DUF3747 domain-containing protein [Okeania sp. SIO3B5]